MLFPCLEEEEPTTSWNGVLERYDPDVIVDLVGISTKYLDFQRLEQDRVVVCKQDNRSQPRREGWLGAPVFAALHRWKRLRVPSEEIVTVGSGLVTPRLDLPDNHPLALPLAFRYGIVSSAPPEDGFDPWSPWRKADLGHYVEIRDVSVKDMAESELIPFVTAPHDIAAAPWPGITAGQRLFTLTQLTALGLRPTEPPHIGGLPSPEREQHNEWFYRNLLVVGAPTSVPDLCLAWNLRAQRRLDCLLPLWVSPDWLGREEVKRQIGLAISMVDGSGLLEGRERPRLRLLSASIPRKALGSLHVEYSGEIVAHDADDLGRFFTDSFRVGIQQQAVVHFSSRGSAHIQTPDYAEMADFGHFDRVCSAIEITGYMPPRIPAQHLELLGSVQRIASDGIVDFLHPGSDPPRGLRLIGVPSGWETLEAIAANAGYAVGRSDKGRLTVAMISLLGGRAGLELVASSLIYSLLREMAQIEPRQALQQARIMLGGEASTEDIDKLADTLHLAVLAEGQFHRQHVDWGRLDQKMGKIAESRLVLDWLVAHRILFRGYEFHCTNCGLRRWHPIDRLAEKVTCEGCLETIPAPVPVGTLPWKYRLNEIVAKAVDQGVLPHLLASRRLNEWGGPGEQSEFLGYYPGVEFKQKDGSGESPLEADFVAIVAGKPVIGEMKATGKELTRRDVDRMLVLARRLKCSRIIFGTPTTFRDVGPLVHAAQDAAGSTQVMTWEEEDILDRPMHVSDEKRPPREYLQDVARWLSSKKGDRY